MLQKLPLICTISLLLPISGFAKEMEMEMKDLLKLSLEELLEVPIISASKYEQESSEAPASVSVVTAEDIKRYGYRSIGQLLASLQGIYFVRGNTFGFVSIRGFFRSASNGARIAVLIDGHRINDNLFGMANVDTGFPLDMDVIERVEVVRGSSSSLYGQGAFFGVINVITKSAAEHKGVVVSTEVDVNPDRYYGNATVGQTFANGAQLLLSAGISDRPGENVYIPESDNPPMSDGISHQHDYHKTKRLFAKLSYQDLTLTASYIDRDLGMHGGLRGMLFDYPNWYQDNGSYIDARYRHEFSDRLETNVRLSWNHFGMRVKSHFDYGDYIATNRVDIPTNWLNAEWQWQWQNDPHRVVSGVEYQYSLLQRQRSYNDEPFYVEVANIKSDQGYWAIYVQDEVQLTDQLTLNAGLRYDYYEAFGGTSNPRLAMIYQMNDHTTWKLLGGKAFRAPNAQEQYYEDKFFLKRNPDGVKPETVVSYELVLEHQFDSHLRGAASVFYYQVEDLIDTTIDPVEHVALIYGNFGSANAHGLEMTIDKHWQNGLETHFNYTWQHAVDGDSNEQLTNSPKHMLKARASLPLNAQWRANAEMSYIGSTKVLHAALANHDERAHADVPAYTVTDLSLTGTPLKNLELGLHVYNLFDQEVYYPAYDEYRGMEKLQGDRRSLRLKLSYRF